MRVGAHVSVAGGVDTAVERLRDVGGTCGQIFTTSPRVWQLPSLDNTAIERFREQTGRNAVGPWVIHSVYLVNLATPNSELRQQSIERLQADVDAAAQLGVEYVNVHPGAHTGAGVDRGLENTVSAIDELEIPDTVTLLVETDAGSGTKLAGHSIISVSSSTRLATTFRSVWILLTCSPPGTTSPLPTQWRRPWRRSPISSAVNTSQSFT